MAGFGIIGHQMYNLEWKFSKRNNWESGTQTNFSTNFGGKLSFILSFLFLEHLQCCYIYFLLHFCTQIKTFCSAWGGRFESGNCRLPTMVSGWGGILFHSMELDLVSASIVQLPSSILLLWNRPTKSKHQHDVHHHSTSTSSRSSSSFSLLMRDFITHAAHHLPFPIMSGFSTASWPPPSRGREEREK